LVGVSVDLIMGILFAIVLLIGLLCLSWWAREEIIDGYKYWGPTLIFLFIFAMIFGLIVDNC